MKNLKGKLAFGLVAALVIFGFAFEQNIRRFVYLQGAFDLGSVPFSDYSGRKEKIDTNYRGFVVFYSDLVGCSSCMRRLGNLSGLDKIYPEVGFYAISRKAQEGRLFAEMMLEYNIPGVYLVDELRILQAHLGLSDRPTLLFFTKEGRLLTSFPMDLTHPDLKKQIHRYLNEL